MPETKHLIDVARWIQHQQVFLRRADETLDVWKHEVLLAKLYETPQSASHHAEGKTVRDHLRLMLASLYAICDGQVHLNEIEEFARMKGYGEEIKEMEEMMTENPSTFEAFALLHDVGKQFRLFKDAAREMHYHGHPKDIYRTDVKELVARVAEKLRLQDRDVDMLVTLISFHMEPLARFSTGHQAKDVDLISKFATDQGQDADDFIDMLQACVLLDQVFGSRRGGPMCPPQSIDSTALVNFFIAEREYAPWKAEQREKERVQERKRMEQKILVEAGLDGHGIMTLTGMRPGRELGSLLKKIQVAVIGEELVEIDGLWKDEIQKRIAIARQKLL